MSLAEEVSVIHSTPSPVCGVVRRSSPWARISMTDGQRNSARDRQSSHSAKWSCGCRDMLRQVLEDPNVASGIWQSWQTRSKIQMLVTTPPTRCMNRSIVYASARSWRSLYSIIHCLAFGWSGQTVWSLDGSSPTGKSEGPIFVSITRSCSPDVIPHRDNQKCQRRWAASQQSSPWIGS